jgi:hypothetical protein
MMFELLLGHLTGDYLLQNEWMALNKSKNTLIGWTAAILHCLIYTWTICIFMGIFDFIWWIAVFLTHFPIDKFALGEKYMKLKGSSLRAYIDDTNNSTSKFYVDTSNGQKILTGGFRAVVYAVTDNTMHLVLMYLAYKIIY